MTEALLVARQFGQHSFPSSVSSVPDESKVIELRRSLG